MAKEWKERMAAAAGLCALAVVLAGCGEATPTWGPGSPRNGAGQPVNPIYGTPIPGYPQVPK
jgi:hypothetical protein